MAHGVDADLFHIVTLPFITSFVFKPAIIMSKIVRKELNIIGSFDGQKHQSTPV